MTMLANSHHLNDLVEDDRMLCHIRRNASQGWIQARPHHHAALRTFLASHLRSIYIQVPHVDGGNFCAYFRRINDEFSQYTDESGNRVDIMMSTPARAGFINRIIAPY